MPTDSWQELWRAARETVFKIGAKRERSDPRGVRSMDPIQFILPFCASLRSRQAAARFSDCERCRAMIKAGT